MFQCKIKCILFFGTEKLVSSIVQYGLSWNIETFVVDVFVIHGQCEASAFSLKNQVQKIADANGCCKILWCAYGCAEVHWRPNLLGVCTHTGVFFCCISYGSYERYIIYICLFYGVGITVVVRATSKVCFRCNVQYFFDVFFIATFWLRTNVVFFVYIGCPAAIPLWCPHFLPNELLI